MRRLIRCGALAVLAGSAVAVTAGAEELTLVKRLTTGAQPPLTQTTYVSNEKMRIEGGGSDVLFDFASGTLTMIDTKKKEYSVLTPQDFEAMAAQVKAMEEQMKSMPAFVRDKMPGGGGAPVVTVIKGTGGKTLAGYACDNWVVTIGNSTQDHCVTTQLAFPVPAYDGMMRNMKAMGLASPMFKGMDQMIEKFKQMKGVSIYDKSTMKFMGKTMESTTELVEARKGAIPASAWEVPAGFKKIQSPLAKMGK